MQKKITVKLIAFLILILSISCKNKSETKSKAIDCVIPPEITYTNTVATIIETNCFECHAKEVYKKKASRIKIYDYKSLKKMATNGFLIGAITHANGFIPMPYKKGYKIEDCAIQILNKWVSTGMKE